MPSTVHAADFQISQLHAFSFPDHLFSSLASWGYSKVSITFSLMLDIKNVILLVSGWLSINSAFLAVSQPSVKAVRNVNGGPWTIVSPFLAVQVSL